MIVRVLHIGLFRSRLCASLSSSLLPIRVSHAYGVSSDVKSCSQHIDKSNEHTRAERWKRRGETTNVTRARSTMQHDSDRDEQILESWRHDATYDTLHLDWRPPSLLRLLLCLPPCVPAAAPAGPPSALISHRACLVACARPASRASRRVSPRRDEACGCDDE